tara:strand:- start:185 stop:376 length:192 start_codon:yes stop_codon:yes gene_type:complete
MLGIFEANRDDGDSYLIDNFVVTKSANFDDPYNPTKVLFEGTQEECEQYVGSQGKRVWFVKNA